MSEAFDIWKFLAGLGIFMFGMFLMEESIKKLSGRAFKRFIRERTTGKFKAITSGALITAILQSSSAVSLMILAFVGAGIMSMQNAIGVILGSNIGTTVTAWIVASIGFKMNIESFALPLIGIGGLGLIFLGRSERYSNFSKLLAGFGFLFMGLDFMKVSVELYATHFDIAAMATYGIMAYVGIGVMLTVIMQSSSAAMAIVLTALNANIIGFDSAAATVIGANMGTTVTILLGSIGGIQVKKRVAYSHFLFNLVTGLVALALFRIMVYLVQETFGFANDPVLGLALFHTLFNVLGVLIFIPLIPLLAKGLMKIFPEQKNVLAQYINNTTTDVSEAAISAMQKEVEHLVDLVLKHNLAVLHIDQNLVFSHYDYLTPSRKKVRESLALQYANIKVLQAEVFTYAGKIQEQELMESEADAISRYLHCARSALHSAKTLKDIQRDLEEFENADNRFLNEQYTHFRKRLIETYLKIDKLRDNEVDDNLSTAFLMIMNALDKDDTLFIKLTSQASQRKHINEIDISTALIVNRAFVQSSRQIILAIRELKLETHEIEEIEHIQEVAEELIEDHEAS